MPFAIIIHGRSVEATKLKMNALIISQTQFSFVHDFVYFVSFSLSRMRLKLSLFSQEIINEEQFPLLIHEAILIALFPFHFLCFIKCYCCILKKLSRQKFKLCYLRGSFVRCHNVERVSTTVSVTNWQK